MSGLLWCVLVFFYGDIRGSRNGYEALALSHNCDDNGTVYEALALSHNCDDNGTVYEALALSHNCDNNGTVYEALALSTAPGLAALLARVARSGACCVREGSRALALRFRQGRGFSRGAAALPFPRSRGARAFALGTRSRPRAADQRADAAG